MPNLNAEWPVLTRYEGRRLAQVALPLGGIGTGTVSLGGRGQLQDWELADRPAKGYNGGQALFCLYARPEGGEGIVRVLEGALLPPFEGSHGVRAPYHGLPRLRECTFHAAYPLAQVRLADPDLPLDVRLEALNPLIPADAEASGIPMAALRFVLTNKNARAVTATVCGTLSNFCGDAPDGSAAGRKVNRYREDHGLRGLLLSVEDLPEGHEYEGTLALTTSATDVSYRTAWRRENRWRGAMIGFWDDLLEDGRLNRLEPGVDDEPIASLAARVSVPPNGEATIPFLLTWRFPNRQSWSPPPTGDAACDCGCEGKACCGPAVVGNHYATQYADAWDVATRAMPRLAELERQTVRFVRAFCESDLPPVVKEAALYNLSTLRSQTSFRTADGRFYGWEGCHDTEGCCRGSCTHVWNYEQASAFLFGDLARSLREVEFLHATDERGHMSFRIELPLERAREYGIAAADGQMGCILKAYRDWQLCGDDEWLRKLWPAIRRALAYAWVPGGWDADGDGVMEGCQHNTLDVEYYGPNPLMAGWYLGALRAGEEMARHMGDEAFAARCRDLFQRGSAWVDAHLFNGEYYEQRVMPPAPDAPLADGLRSSMGATDLSDPDFQMGPGCLVDQLVGQLMAHVCGLGYLLDPTHVRATLQSIRRYNGRSDLYGHFNPMRTFALNDERALLMCAYPRGGRPRRPVPYYAEVMTGFEYAAATHMLYEGLIDEGLACIDNIRTRYDGERRNPFNEAECGHHYARAMTSWAAVLALTGFHYTAVEQRMAFAAKGGRHFWSTGCAWGICEITLQDDEAEISLDALGGALSLRQFALTGFGQALCEAPLQVAPGRPLHMTLARTEASV
ncbi:MAG: hypothetical protein JXA74_01320 [Anaerolineae bacterium]|nr:hypothetical protein [Anaerolineae bacterium]